MWEPGFAPMSFAVYSHKKKSSCSRSVLASEKKKKKDRNEKRRKKRKKRKKRTKRKKMMRK